MKIALLLGANHAHQYPGHRDGQADVFRSFVVKEALRHGVDLLAEEMNQEALANVQVKHSVIHAAAEALQIGHLYCDPDTSERAALGILSEKELKAKHGICSVLTPEFEADERSYWIVREDEWLRRISFVSHERLFFILGPKHVVSFTMLLQKKGYEVQVISPCWKP